MRIIKNIELGLDVENPLEVALGGEPVLMQMLADAYESTCNAGCYIEKINRILARGQFIINQCGDASKSTISITCEVTAIVFAQGEIINGCVVANHSEKIITCGTPIVSAMLNDTGFESVTAGQIISIRVGQVRYNKCNKKIAVNAIAYLPAKTATAYRVTGMKAPDGSFFDDVLARIVAEEAATAEIKKSNAKAWETFTHFLYAYKDTQKTPAGAKQLDVRDLAKGVGGASQYLCRDPRMDLSEPIVLSYADEPQGDVRDDLSTEQVVLLLLEDYCSHLRTLREMIEAYNTPALLQSHKNLWQILSKNKI